MSCLTQFVTDADPALPEISGTTLTRIDLLALLVILDKLPLVEHPHPAPVVRAPLAQPLPPPPPTPAAAPAPIEPLAAVTVATPVDVSALVGVSASMSIDVPVTPEPASFVRPVDATIIQRAGSLAGLYRGQTNFPTYDEERTLIALAQLMAEQLGQPEKPLRARVPHGATDEMIRALNLLAAQTEPDMLGLVARAAQDRGDGEPELILVCAVAIVYKWFVIACGAASRETPIHAISVLNEEHDPAKRYTPASITAWATATAGQILSTHFAGIEHANRAKSDNRTVFIVFEDAENPHFVVVDMHGIEATVYEPMVKTLRRLPYTDALYIALADADCRTATRYGTQGVVLPRAPLYTTRTPTTTTNVCGYHAAYMAAWLATGHVPASARFVDVPIPAGAPEDPLVAAALAAAAEKAKTDNWVEPIQEMYDAMTGLGLPRQGSPV
ncbi:MAG: hypothetical protein WC732_09830 [Candidatus Omnitrophota bacterium]